MQLIKFSTGLVRMEPTFKQRNAMAFLCFGCVMHSCSVSDYALITRLIRSVTGTYLVIECVKCNTNPMLYKNFELRFGGIKRT